MAASATVWARGLTTGPVPSGDLTAEIDLGDSPPFPDDTLHDRYDAGAVERPILPYDAVRTAPDPEAALLASFESASRAGAETAGWDLQALESSHPKGER